MAGVKCFATQLKGGQWGIANQKGEVTSKVTYTFVQQYFQGRFIANRYKKWGVVSPHSDTIINFDYEYLAHFKNQNKPLYWLDIPYYKAKKEGNWGVIDTVGNEIIPYTSME